MSGLKFHKDTAAIVLLGNFNPVIFHPQWLASKKLIRESEASGATVDVVHPEVSRFGIGWAKLTISRDRFLAETLDPSHQAPLRDLVVGIFELLEHTPTNRLGLNRDVHVDLNDSGTWHALGHRLAPKEPWKGILRTKPGMMNLAMSDEQIPPPGQARMTVHVAPSTFAHTASILVNAEYVAPDSREHDRTGFFVERIREDWESTMREATEVVERLVRVAKGES